MKFTAGVVALNAGEWSPRLWGRYDQAKYGAAMRECSNFMPTTQGPLVRRPGTIYVQQTYKNDDDTRLVPFVYSDTQSYILEFSGTDNKVRFFRDGAAITEAAKNITGITQANPGVVTSTAHGYSNGDEVFIQSVGGMTELNGRWFRVAGVAANTFQLVSEIDGTNIDTSGYTAYTSGGTSSKRYMVAHPYGATDLPNIKWAQSLDVLYIFCPSFAVRTLTRGTSDTSWTFATKTYDDGPFLPENSTPTKLTVTTWNQTEGGSTNFSFSGTTGVNGGAGLTSNDVGRLVWYLVKDTVASGPFFDYAVGRVTSVSSTTAGAMTILRQTDDIASYDQQGNKTRWRLGVWSDNFGHPSCGGFGKARLWLANTDTYPENVWASSTSDFDSFAPATGQPDVVNALPVSLPTNAISLYTGEDTSSRVRWVASSRVIVTGTSSGEKLARANALDEVPTPETAQVIAATQVGCADTPPARVDESVFFIDRTRRKLVEIAYDFQADAFRSIDHSIWAEHLGSESQFKRVAWQRSPWRVLWVVRDDGLLLGMSFDRDQQLLAWHRHAIGGTDAAVHDIAVVPSDGTDQVWLLVSRTIGGGTKYYIERMADDYWPADANDKTGWVLLDASLSYSGASTATITGLRHLAGETVSVLAGGATHPDVTVSAAGAVTLTRSVTDAVIGYPYTSRMETMDLLNGTQDAPLGKRRAVTRAWVQLFNSLGGSAGVSGETLRPILYRTPGDAMDASPPLRTAVVQAALSGGYAGERTFVVETDAPLPLNISGLGLEEMVN